MHPTRSIQHKFLQVNRRLYYLARLVSSRGSWAHRFKFAVVEFLFSISFLFISSFFSGDLVISYRKKTTKFYAVSARDDQQQKVVFLGGSHGN